MFASYGNVKAWLPQLWGEKFPAREALRVVLACVSLALFSQVALPFYPVPLNMGTYGVLLVGFALPWGQAFLSVFLWMTLGVLGLPVFACFSGGPGVLMGPRGGYLVGYLVAVLFLSLFSRWWRKACTPQTNFVGYMVGQGVIATVALAGVLALGWMHLSWVIGHGGVAWDAGVFPFLLSEPVKIALFLYTVVRKSFPRAQEPQA